MRPVVVLGAGALGSLIAALLSRVTAVDLVCREAAARAIERQGGVLVDGIRAGLYPVAATTALRPRPDAVIVVAVKAYDLETSLHELAPTLDASHRVVVLQNGLGIRTLARRVLGCDVVRAVTFMAACLEAPGRVAFRAAGTTYFPAQEEVARLWRAAELGARQVPGIATYVWRKVAINAVINPLSALLGVPNGELLGLHATAQALVAELVPVARAEGQPLEIAATLAKVQASMRQTAHNTSSMLQDVRAGRRTEIDWINGQIVERAAAHGLRAPRHRQLVELVHFAERRAGMAPPASLPSC